MALQDLIKFVGNNPLVNQMGNIVSGAIQEGQEFLREKPLPSPNESRTINQPTFGQMQTPSVNQRETNEILKQLQSRINQPIDMRNIKDDPYYKAAQQQIQSQSKEATRRAMEELNARGILPSTVTAETLGDIEQQAAARTAGIIPQLYEQRLAQRQRDISNLANLYDISRQREQTAFNRQRQMQMDQLQQRKSDVDNALRRIEFNNGIVDRESSLILGIPEGRMSQAARNRVEKRKQEIEDATTAFERQQEMVRLQDTLAKERGAIEQENLLERQRREQESALQRGLALERARAGTQASLEAQREERARAREDRAIAREDELNKVARRQQAVNLARQALGDMATSQEILDMARRIERYTTQTGAEPTDIDLGALLGSAGQNILGTFQQGLTEGNIRQGVSSGVIPGFEGIEDYLQ